MRASLGVFLGAVVNFFLRFGSPGYSLVPAALLALIERALGFHIPAAHIDDDVFGVGDGIGFCAAEQTPSLQLGSPLQLVLERVLHRRHALGGLAVLDGADELCQGTLRQAAALHRRDRQRAHCCLDCGQLDGPVTFPECNRAVGFVQDHVVSGLLCRIPLLGEVLRSPWPTIGIA